MRRAQKEGFFDWDEVFAAKASLKRGNNVAEE